MSDENLQPLTEHLSELRRRILWILMFFVLALIISFAYSMDIFHYVQKDLFPGVDINAFSPGDALKVFMQISFILSFIIVSPVILYHLWQFVRPGLHPKEQRAALMYIPVAVVLFLLGLSFGYFVIFPFLITFMTTLNAQMGIQETYGVYQAFSFVVNIVFPIALFFELPVIVLFLTRIRLINPDLLRKVRRFAYLALVIAAAVITPPDVISNILVAIPLVVLYEISIAVSAWLYRRLEKEDLVQEMEDE